MRWCKKKLFVICIAAVFSVCFVGCTKSVAEQIREQLGLENQYLLEMDYENAIVAFEKAIELDDKNPVVYMALGEAYSEFASYMEETQAEDDEVFGKDSLSYIEKAIEVYEQGEQLNGEDGDIAIGLAGLYDQMGNYYINHYSEENAPAAYETARSYYEQAVERYNKILEDDTENINAITGIAEANNKLGDYYTANEDYENAKEVYESANEHCELAIEICKELLETDPNNQTVAEQLGNLYIETGNIKEWLELAEKYPQIDSGEREEYREIADVTDKIAALCELEDYLGAAGLMADDQFMACWNFVREQKNPFFINFGDKKMGIYYTRNRGSYISAGLLCLLWGL